MRHATFRRAGSLVLMLALGSSARAADVLLVVEDNDILRQIAQSFQSEFKGAVEQAAFSAGTADQVTAALKRSPKVVVALGPGAAKHVREQAKDSPLLFAGVPNPRKFGLDAPNVGGVLMTLPAKRQWAVARKALGAKRFGVLLSKDNVDRKADAEEAGRELGVAVKIGAISDEMGLSEALKSLEGEVDAIWIPLDPAVANQVAFKAVVDFALKRKLPLIVPAPSYVKQGGLVSVSIGYPEMGRRLARQAQGVVAGATPQAAAAKTPEGEEVSVNPAVAQAIGVTLPAELLQKALVQ